MEKDDESWRTPVPDLSGYRENVKEAYIKLWRELDELNHKERQKNKVSSPFRAKDYIWPVSD